MADGSEPIVPVPRLRLDLGTQIRLDGRLLQVERRLGDRWQLIDCEDKDVLLMGDKEIVGLQARGKLQFVWKPGMGDTDQAPSSPLLASGAGYQRSQRKADYVLACLRAPGFRRSRSALEPILKEVADQRGEKAPGFSTVLGWIKKYELFGEEYGSAALADKIHQRGRKIGRLPDYQERAIEVGLNRYLRPGMSMVDAYSAVVRAVRIFEANNRGRGRQSFLQAVIDNNGRLRPPSLSTFHRRCLAYDPIVREVARRGMRSAKQKFKTWRTMPLPDRPYAEVEVDHSRLDIQVIDPDGLVLGRPDLIVFRDRATAMILGYGLGFEEPSYDAFLQGLRHAMYPKDLSLFAATDLEWPCYGRIGDLHVDNALHFIGDNIRSAGRELGFNVVRLQPRQPWLKGALERFFRTLNEGLVHKDLGTTLANFYDRNQNEELGDPALTLDEFEALLTHFICKVYHSGPRKALGVIRGVGAEPIRAWREKAERYETPPLPDRELFIALAGDRDRRTIQRNGITWDHITYESHELIGVLSNAKHRARASGQSATTYEVVRDPSDLGQIHLIDHHAHRRITVPATLAHQAYASGRTLHQHRVIMAHAKRRGEGANWEALIRARDELASVVEEMRRHPSRKTLERRVARFLGADRAQRFRTEIEVLAPTADAIRSASCRLAVLEASSACSSKSVLIPCAMSRPRPHRC